MREALQERGRVLLDAFSARCEQEGIPCDTALPIGIVANEICDQARTADLVVVGHRGVNEQFSTGPARRHDGVGHPEVPEARPVTPLEFREIGRPLLAYDGSQRASAAMHAAAEVDERARPAAHRRPRRPRRRQRRRPGARRGAALPRSRTTSS